jgi:hypothetical protein
MLGLIFGDQGNRGGRRGPVEPVTEADLDLVFREIVPHGKKAARGEHSVERKVRGVAEIRIAVLGPHPPIVGDRIFDAATGSPTSTRVRKAGKGSWNTSEESGCVGNAGVEAAEGNTAGAVEEGAIPGNADASTDRALDTCAGGGVALPKVSPAKSINGTTTVLLKLVPSAEPSAPITNHGLSWRL